MCSNSSARDSNSGWEIITVNNEKRYTLGDALPKTNPWWDDRLGYASFAKRIAGVITKMEGPNSYVIGVAENPQP
jgi:hypothetical protein